ncbi:hypothetical protein MP638_005028, partial [Amoeboaphelidium occidentale]
VLLSTVVIAQQNIIYYSSNNNNEAEEYFSLEDRLKMYQYDQTFSSKGGDGGDVWKFCDDYDVSKYTVTVYKVSVLPQIPTIGDDLEVSVDLYSDHEIMDGSKVQMDVRVGGLPLQKEFDLCSLLKDHTHTECPLQKGNHTFTVKVNIPSSIPAVSLQGKVLIHEAPPKAEGLISCFEVDFKLKKKSMLRLMKQEYRWTLLDYNLSSTTTTTTTTTNEGEGEGEGGVPLFYQQDNLTLLIEEILKGSQSIPSSTEDYLGKNQQQPKSGVSVCVEDGMECLWRFQGVFKLTTTTTTTTPEQNGIKINFTVPDEYVVWIKSKEQLLNGGIFSVNFEEGLSSSISSGEYIVILASSLLRFSPEHDDLKHFLLSDELRYDLEYSSSYSPETSEVVVTLVTCLTPDRLERVFFTTSIWTRQPMVCVLYIRDFNDVLVLSNYIENIASRRNNVRFILIKRQRKDYNNRSYFPINDLRNVGIGAVETKYYFYIEADFYPSEGLDLYIQEKVVPFIERQSNPVAVIIPCFSMAMNVQIKLLPKTKKQLKQVMKDQPRVFYVPDSRAGHRATQNHVYLDKLEQDGFYEVCFESQWEPYYVLERKVPKSKFQERILESYTSWLQHMSATPHKRNWIQLNESYSSGSTHSEWSRDHVLPLYDDRYANQGGDKQIHSLLLNSLGYRFFVASNHFIIHLDHNGYFNWDGGWKRDFQQENKNAISFFDEGLQELEHFFDCFIFAAMPTLSLFITDGKLFPKNSTGTLILSATFRGKTLESVAVPCSPNPQFGTEFLWPCSDDQLEAWKAQRTMIRLQCNSISGASNLKRTLGYLLIDVRFCNDKQAKFRPLNGTMPGTLKPQVKYCFCVKVNDQDAENNSSVANTVAPSYGKSKDYFSLNNLRQDNQDIWSLSLYFNVPKVDHLNGPHYLEFHLISCIRSEEFDSASSGKTAEEIKVKLGAKQEDVEGFIQDHFNPLRISLVSAKDQEVIATSEVDGSHLCSDGILVSQAALKPVEGYDFIPVLLDLNLTLQKGNTRQETTQLPQHSFRLSIDIHSIQITSDASCVYCGYNYPLMKTQTAAFTSSVAKTPDSSDSSGILMQILPDGFRAYEFISDPVRVRKTLSMSPLRVEIFKKEADKETTVIGVCEVEFSSLFQGQKSIKREDGSLVYFFDKTIDIKGPEGTEEKSKWSRKIGCLRVIAALEDFGEVDQNEIQQIVSEQRNTYSATNDDETDDQELRIWGAEQKRSFKSITREISEKQALLASDLNRQVELNVRSFSEDIKTKMMKDIEGLRLLLQGLQTRAKYLDGREMEIQRKTREKQQDHDNRMKSLESAKKRYVKEAQHMLSAEKDKIQQIKQSIDSEKSAKMSLEAEIKQLKMKIEKQTQSKIKDTLKSNVERQDLKNEVKRLKDKAQTLKSEKMKYIQRFNDTKRDIDYLQEEKRLYLEEMLAEKEELLNRQRIEMLLKEEMSLLNKDKESISELKQALQTIIQQACMRRSQGGTSTYDNSILTE